MQPDVQVWSLVKRLRTEHGGYSHHGGAFYLISRVVYVTWQLDAEFSSWTCPTLMICFLESSGIKRDFREHLRYWGVTWVILHMEEITEKSCTHLQPRQKSGVRMSGVRWRCTRGAEQGRTPAGPPGKSRRITHQERGMWRRKWHVIFEGSSFLGMEGARRKLRLLVYLD